MCYEVRFDLYFVYVDGTTWEYSLRGWNHDIGLRWICGNMVYLDGLEEMWKMYEFLFD